MDLAFTGEEKRKTGPTKKWSEGEIEAELKKFADKLEDDKANHGEIEQRDTILDKADFLRYEVEDFVEAEKVYREAYTMTGGASKKMEILFECLLMEFQKEEVPKIEKFSSGDITDSIVLITALDSTKPLLKKILNYQPRRIYTLTNIF